MTSLQHASNSPLKPHYSVNTLRGLGDNMDVPTLNMLEFETLQKEFKCL